ncbi:MAG TPA: protein kinase [Candidatus Acidoferrum sp.]|nr:protein kinase [Candidatus Acidoferrum sp.]
MIGQNISHYRVIGLLGVGGMGEVYRATDTKLRREVALKVLPQSVASDPQRMARFEREAQFLAALNHPNIAAIYGLEDSGATRALVIELVEGPTVADRVAQGAIPVEEALPIARQIAEALEYAHERGIVHRDLKPANVKIKPDGTVKVLDFGLAKALDEDLTQTDISKSPTLTAAATTAGFILGTAGYMSPEQARGKSVDRRSDIWSFGAVLFEMLTGKMAFYGETVSDTLAAVIRAEPNWLLLPANVPRAIRTLLLRCLHKDPRQRLQSIGEARIAIENSLSGSSSSEQLDPSPVVAPRASEGTVPRRIAAAALGALPLALGFLLANFLRHPEELSSPVIHFAISPPLGTSLNVGGPHALAISPDGSRIVLCATTAEGPRLYLRNMNSADAALIPGTEGGQDPRFSPDGSSLAFNSSGKLKRIALGGGPPLPLMDLPLNSYGSAWGEDQSIYFAPTLTSPILRAGANGDAPQPVTKLLKDKGELGHISPQLLPGYKALLFTVWMGGNFDDGPLVAQRLDTGARKMLAPNGFDPRFLPPNHLLYVRNGNLMAVEFDPRSLAVTGDAVSVIQDVAMRPGFGTVQYDASRNGTLIYIRGGKRATENSLLLAEHDAKAQPFPLKPNLYESPRFSPDGKQLALTVRLPDVDIWIYDIERGALRRITFAPGEDELPVWSPDGKRVAFASNGRQQAFVVPADGSGQEESLMKSDTHFHLQSWSPDGKLIAFERLGNSGWEIWMLPMEGDRKAYPYLQGQFQELHPAFSTDGRWLAYTSGESGRAEVYVQRFPGPGEKVQVSTDGGRYPVWSRDGHRLIYENSGTLWAVDVTSSPGFRVGKAHVLYQGDIWNDAAGPNYALSPDGKRFVVVERSKDSTESNINVILNWNEELLRLTGSGNK